MTPLLDQFDPAEREILEGTTPLVLLCGTPRSGKSSILSVVFNHESPSQTIFNEPTIKPVVSRLRIGDLFDIAVMEIPTHYFTGAPSSDEFDRFLFERASSVWVIVDCTQTPYQGHSSVGALTNDLGSPPRPTLFPSELKDAISVPAETQATTDTLDSSKSREHLAGEELMFCRDIVRRAKACDALIMVDIFLHKMDGTRFGRVDLKTAVQRDIFFALRELLSPTESADIMMFSTTIYDYSVKEALSHMIHRLVPQTVIVNRLADILLQHCHAFQAFVFDSRTGLIAGMDSSAFDPICYELCADMLEIISTSALLRNEKSPDHHESPRSTAVARRGDLRPGSGGSPENGPSRRWVLSSGKDEAAMDQNGAAANKSLLGECLSYPYAESATVTMENGFIIQLQQIGQCTSVGLVLKEDAFETQHLVDVNVAVFATALREAMDLFDDFGSYSTNRPTPRSVSGRYALDGFSLRNVNDNKKSTTRMVEPSDTPSPITPASVD